MNSQPENDPPVRCSAGLGGGRKPELRRMLMPAQRVRVSGLSPAADGTTGVVLRMIERGVASDSITSEGWWTIEVGDMHRDFQRRYLRRAARPLGAETAHLGRGDEPSNDPSSAPGQRL